MIEENNEIYKWEKGIQRSWDTVVEDAEGNIKLNQNKKSNHYKQIIDSNKINQCIRRGLIRYLVVAIDCSISAGENDIGYRPSRIESSKHCLHQFILDYFDQNPISNMSLIATRDRIAERLTELSGNPKNHIHKLKALSKTEGSASLQNTILLAISILRHIPQYGQRELLIVYSSLSTCDPSDIFETIQAATTHRVRISVICLVAEIFICKRLSELTGGRFSVASDTVHLSLLLQSHTTPPPQTVQDVEDKAASMMTDFIYMGFPKRSSDLDNNNVFGFDGKQVSMSATGYICPRCSCRAAHIPAPCCVCSLPLHSSAHIARSYHHLFPVPTFSENKVDMDNNNTSTMSDTDVCTGCYCSISSSVVSGEDSFVYQCPTCHNQFCQECDLFIHESLHNCPGCG